MNKNKYGLLKPIIFIITVILIQFIVIIILMTHSNLSSKVQQQVSNDPNKGNKIVERNYIDTIRSKYLNIMSPKKTKLEHKQSSIKQVGIVTTPYSEGSGVLIDDNKILTATHVIVKPNLDLCQNFSLKFYVQPQPNQDMTTQKYHEVKKIEQFQHTELTVLTLKHKIKNIKPLKIAKNEPKTYDEIKNVGYHKSSTITDSQFQSKGQFLYSRHDYSGKNQDVMLGCTKLYHGMSGGPVLNSKNEIIGINSFMYDKEQIGGFVSTKQLID